MNSKSIEGCYMEFFKVERSNGINENESDHF